MLSSNPRVLVGGTHKNGTVNLSLSASSRKNQFSVPWLINQKDRLSHQNTSVRAIIICRTWLWELDFHLGVWVAYLNWGKRQEQPFCCKRVLAGLKNWLVLLEHRRSKQESLTHDPWHLSGVVGFCLLKNAEHRRSTPNHAETVRWQERTCPTASPAARMRNRPQCELFWWDCSDRPPGKVRKSQI